MNSRNVSLPLILLLAAGLAFAAFADRPSADAEHWTFEVHFEESLRAEPYTGRVYVFFGEQDSAGGFFGEQDSAGGGAEPRFGPNWFAPQPFLAKEVVDLQPGESVTLSFADARTTDGQTLSFPQDAAHLTLHGRQAQAVVRFDQWDRRVGDGIGNGYSAVTQLDDPAAPVRLNVNQLVEEEPWQDTNWSKLLRERSEKLSDFYGHDVFMEAVVLLPASYYEQPDRQYPVMYQVLGFSGRARQLHRSTPVAETNTLGVEFIRVIVDANCPTGHCVFADSANNGPWGAALTQEFIPAVERKYRAVGQPSARFLTGHSSGGWSTLWLQVTYPEMFAGTWSTAPDPVDFRDFQRINLYLPGANMHVDDHGERRPLARRRGEPFLWYDRFDHMETVLGQGGQLASFEAVFSPRGQDGQPRPLWDRETGAIDPVTAESWQAYDINLLLKQNWASLAPKLKGKLHIFTGDADTFYLEGAVALLKETLQELGSDAVVEIHPGKDHGSLLTRQLRARISQEMAEQFRSAHSHE